MALNRVFRSAFDSDTIDVTDSLEFEQELFEATLQQQKNVALTTDQSGEAEEPFNSIEATDGHGFVFHDYEYHNFNRERTAAEIEYYSDYDPVIGYRIAISLGILILLFTVFVLYKTHCHQQKNRRLVAQNSNAQSNSAQIQLQSHPI